MVRFVSEFGAQAVPESDEFMDPDRWPDLDWDGLTRHHALQPWIFDQRVPPARYTTFDEWRQATQRYQATVLKHHIEHLRRLKYRPTGGFCFFLLNDAQPAVSWSVLDHERRAKLGFHAVTDACRPVIVVADRVPDPVAPGKALALDIHAVSDLREDLVEAEVRAALSWPGGHHGWRWEGPLAADACERVGTVQLVVPEARGRLILDLDLQGTTAGGRHVAASNRYDAVISR
jgi:beta-mannosidase